MMLIPYALASPKNRLTVKNSNASGLFLKVIWK